MPVLPRTAKTQRRGISRWAATNTLVLLTARLVTTMLLSVRCREAKPIWGGTSGGSANAQTITLSPAITAYAAGQQFAFLAGNTNTGACTLNVNGLGTKNIYSNGAACVGGEIVAARIYEVAYDGTQFQLLGADNGQLVAFRAHRDTSVQAIANGATNSIQFNAESYDYGTNFASATFVAPYDGIYHFSSSVQVSGASSTGAVSGYIVTNGGTEIARSTAANSSIGVSMNLSGDIEIAAGVNVFVQLYNDTGATMNVDENSERTNFSGHLIQRT
jgi:hypothetical protein